MEIIVKVPELISPDLYNKLNKFLTEESKRRKCEINQLIYGGSKVKVIFVDVYDYPHSWTEFLKQINSILELDKL